MLELLVLAALATAIVLIWRNSEGVKTIASIGGIGWILWVALQVVRLLVRGG